MRKLFILAIGIVLAASSGARADGDFDAGGGAYRCANAQGKVPGGTASIWVCSDYGTSAFGNIPIGLGNVPFAFVGFPQPVSGTITVTTSKGSDSQVFTFNPTAPNPDVLTTFTMDPVMSSAQISVTTGTITVKVTLASSVKPKPDQDVRLGHGFDTSPLICADAGAGLRLNTPATVVAGSSITSKKVGGGTLSHASGAMEQGIGAGESTSFFPAPNMFVIC